MNSAEDDKESVLPKLRQTELFDIEEGAKNFAASALPTATTVDDPIPAMRSVHAQLVMLPNKNDGKNEGGEENNDSAVLLEDPEGLAQKSIVISIAAYTLASLFNGKRNARDVALAFNEQQDQCVEVKQILELQHELDKAMFLYSQRFEKTLKRHVRGYLNKSIRPAIHAGSAYPADPDALRKMVAGFFSAPDGPGDLNKLLATKIAETDCVRALVVPHIDMRIGGATYAHGYRELISNSQAELFVILGVAHQACGNHLFYVSQKDFATPLGVLQTNRDLARRLQSAADAESFVAEMTHRTEHSIEFQAVMLQTLLKESCNREVQIVPVLCGSVEQFLTEKEDPKNSAPFRKFVECLAGELEGCKKKWCVLCSVDLSHVGPEFEHGTIITEHLLLPVDRGDRRILQHIERLDARAFFDEIVRVQNSRHVDAVLSVMTMLEVCAGRLKSGRVLHYDQMFKKDAHSAVSYAAITFEG
ncbi:MAG: AmmeMemoRadiSam system protein B [Planctomycetota bacterium]